MFYSDVATRVTDCHIILRAPVCAPLSNFVVHIMHTRNSPPQAKDDLPVLPSIDATAKANWSLHDEIAFINYIADHKAEAGDGMKFKTSFWNGAADFMKADTESGGQKTASGCSTKWDRVHLFLHMQ